MKIQDIVRAPLLVAMAVCLTTCPTWAQTESPNERILYASDFHGGLVVQIGQRDTGRRRRGVVGESQVERAGRRRGGGETQQPAVLDRGRAHRVPLHPPSDAQQRSNRASVDRLPSEKTS